MTERRKKQFIREGIDYKKVKEMQDMIFDELSKSCFTLAEAEYLLKTMGCHLEKISKHSPETRIREISQMQAEKRNHQHSPQTSPKQHIMSGEEFKTDDPTNWEEDSSKICGPWAEGFAYMIRLLQKITEGIIFDIPFRIDIRYNPERKKAVINKYIDKSEY